MLRRIDDRQRPLGLTGRQKPLPDLGSDFGNPSGLFIRLGDEGIDVLWASAMSSNARLTVLCLERSAISSSHIGPPDP